MAIKRGINDFLWIALGAAFLLAVMWMALYFRKDRDLASQEAFRARRTRSSSGCAPP
jgi:hypothetical protein